VKRIVWLVLLGVAVYRFTDAGTSARNWWASMPPMGGACEAFMEGGELEDEYRELCADEVLNLWPQYDVAQGIFVETSYLTRTTRPRAADLRLALMAQWGGACDVMRKSIGDDAARRELYMRACLSELYRLRSKAWASLTSRHWRLVEPGLWTTENLPTPLQVERAREAEQFIFAVRKVYFGWLGLALLASGLLSFVVRVTRGLRIRLMTAIRARRKSSAPHQTEGTEAKQNHSWNEADREFRARFSRLFEPDKGSYKTRELRARMWGAYMCAVETRRGKTYDVLFTLMLRTFHPDNAPHVAITREELTDIFQFIGQEFPDGRTTA
jgi:hypothetical protein